MRRRDKKFYKKKNKKHATHNCAGAYTEAEITVETVDQYLLCFFLKLSNGS